jgi:heterodisulfide reductase subunit A-like polyferredoxin
MLKEHNVVRPSNGQVPQKIAFVQCVGSRDRQIGNEYCSKVCCGIASKQAIEIKEQLPDAKVFIFYIDMRMYGYWENEIYWPAQEKYKVNFVKGVISEVLPKNGQLLVRGEDTTMSRPMEVTMDLIVLSVGMEPSAGTRTIAQLLGCPAEQIWLHRSGRRRGIGPGRHIESRHLRGGSRRGSRRSGRLDFDRRSRRGAGSCVRPQGGCSVGRDAIPPH